MIAYFIVNFNVQVSRPFIRFESYHISIVTRKRTGMRNPSRFPFIFALMATANPPRCRAGARDSVQCPVSLGGAPPATTLGLARPLQAAMWAVGGPGPGRQLAAAGGPRRFIRPAAAIHGPRGWAQLHS